MASEREIIEIRGLPDDWWTGWDGWGNGQTTLEAERGDGRPYRVEWYETPGPWVREIRLKLIPVEEHDEGNNDAREVESAKAVHGSGETRRHSEKGAE